MLLIIFTFLALAIWGLTNKIRMNKREKAEATFDNKSEKEIQREEPKADPFEIMQIGARGIQLLESVHIISTTKNPDTLSSRIAYILEFYPSFVALGMFPKQYGNEAIKAVEEYRQRYPDKGISKNAMALLLTPNIETMHNYLANCIVVSYGEFVKQKMADADKLKRDSAKQRRFSEIVEVGYQMKYIFKYRNLPDTGQTEAIEEIRKQFYYKNMKAAN